MSCADYAAVSRQQNLERVCESPAWLVLGCINEKRRVLRVYVPPHLLTSTDPNQSNPAPKHTHTPAPRRSWCGSRSGPSGARSTMSYVPGREASVHDMHRGGGGGGRRVNPSCTRQGCLSEGSKVDVDIAHQVGRWSQGRKQAGGVRWRGWKGGIVDECSTEQASLILHFTSTERGFGPCAPRRTAIVKMSCKSRLALLDSDVCSRRISKAKNGMRGVK